MLVEFSLCDDQNQGMTQLQGSNGSQDIVKTNLSLLEGRSLKHQSHLRKFPVIQTAWKIRQFGKQEMTQPLL